MRSVLSMCLFMSVGLMACGAEPEPLSEDEPLSEEALELTQPRRGICGAPGDTKCSTPAKILQVFKNVKISNVTYENQADPGGWWTSRSVTGKVPRLSDDTSNSTDTIKLTYWELNFQGDYDQVYVWHRNGREVAHVYFQQNQQVGGLDNAPFLPRGGAETMLLTLAQPKFGFGFIKKRYPEAFGPKDPGNWDGAGQGLNYLPADKRNGLCLSCYASKAIILGGGGFLLGAGAAIWTGASLGIGGGAAAATAATLASDLFDCEQACKAGNCNRRGGECTNNLQNVRVLRHNDIWSTPYQCADDLQACCQRAGGFCQSARSNPCLYCFEGGNGF